MADEVIDIGDSPEEQLAATKLQSISRGRKSRKRTVSRKKNKDTEEKRKKDAAARKIQAQQRGRAARQQMALRMKQGGAATRIQAIYRGRHSRRIIAARLAGGRDLDGNDLRKGLSCLGRNPFTLRHAYLTLSCKGTYVKGLAELRKFPQLQTLDLHENFVDGLEELENLPYLTDLDVSSNSLTEVLQYFPPLCKSGGSWNSGDGNFGSTLQRADLSSNKIDAIADISHHSYLNSLNLNRNAISEIQGVAGLKNLQVLRLSHNNIERISGLDGLPLTELALDNNKIKFIENLEKVPCLAKLALGSNEISSLDGLRKCEQLKYLDVASNQIAAIREVEYVQNLPLLCSLVLTGNPVAPVVIPEDPSVPNFYRLRVLVRLQGLTSLDDKLVTSEEKTKAMNLYGGDNSDVLNRARVFKKVFPDMEYTNTLPCYVETEPSCTTNEQKVSFEASKAVFGATVEAKRRASLTPADAVPPVPGA